MHGAEFSQGVGLTGSGCVQLGITHTEHPSATGLGSPGGNTVHLGIPEFLGSGAFESWGRSGQEGGGSRLRGTSQQGNDLTDRAGPRGRKFSPRGSFSLKKKNLFFVSERKLGPTQLFGIGE